MREGRPSKLTPEIRKKILKHVENGLPYQLAAESVGIARSTLQDWKAKNPDLADALKEAEAKSVAVLVARIKKASHENWTAAAWLLERRHPDLFGRVTETRLAVKDDTNKQDTASKVREVFGIIQPVLNGNGHNGNGHAA